MTTATKQTREEIIRDYELGQSTFEDMYAKLEALKDAEEQEFLTCEFCKETGFVEREELAEHQEEEHKYELHDRDCGEGEVYQVMNGLDRCRLCGAEWSED